jgi:hypothetical protein
VELGEESGGEAAAAAGEAAASAGVGLVGLEEAGAGEDAMAAMRRGASSPPPQIDLLHLSIHGGFVSWHGTPPAKNLQSIGDEGICNRSETKEEKGSDKKGRQNRRTDPEAAAAALVLHGINQGHGPRTW